ncbi:MAG: peptidoglycan DD-metalloendopeptidase family protein [Pseudomonadota bacterium]
MSSYPYNRFIRAYIRSALVAITVLIGGCSQVAVPVIDKSPFRKIPPERVVKSGDSIYSIAWEFGLDFEKIALWNGLRKPYALKSGQRLRLRPPGTSTAQTSQPSASSSTVVVSPLPAEDNAVESPPKPKPSPPESGAVPNRPPSQWNWPAKGKLVGRYSPGKGRNGIQIVGQSGTPVLATAGGRVVYAGSGLRGYGNLIIIKHNNDFLSAYAHNDEILVKEGQSVSARQQIARMGNTGSDRVQLHFEIRRDGKPVDPLIYLKQSG